MTKKSIVLLCALFLALPLAAQVWTDAAQLPLYGKATEDTFTRYARLPASLQEVSRPPVWRLGQNSTGLYVRFRTASPTLWVRWESASSKLMNHMSPTGSRGLDLYALEDGKWRFIAAGRPDLKQTVTEQKVMANMEPQMREYMLYLSLYNGVTDLGIGTEEGYPVLQPEVNSPRSERPIVMYGTSITQGGCTSRPGMLYTSIMARRLNREFINLGFSGNAHLDLEIARLMASVPDPALYVIACTENASPEQFAERGEAFFRILRDAHPDVPVIFVEDPHFSHMVLDRAIADEVNGRNAAQKALYEHLVAAGEKNLFYVPSFEMTQQEDFVDGVHFTDLGMTHYADLMEPVLREALTLSEP